MAITDAEMGRVAALAFDYPNYDAIGLSTRSDAGGGGSVTGLHINSRPPAGLDVIEASRVVERRIGIHNREENAEIILADTQGRDRIRLVVDDQDRARIEVLDAQGAVTFTTSQ